MFAEKCSKAKFVPGAIISTIVVTFAVISIAIPISGTSFALFVSFALPFQLQVFVFFLQNDTRISTSENNVAN